MSDVFPNEMPGNGSSDGIAEGEAEMQTEVMGKVGEEPIPGSFVIGTLTKHEGLKKQTSKTAR